MEQTLKSGNANPRMNSVLWVRQISKYNFSSGWDFHWGICRYRGKVIVQPPRILWGDYAHKRSWWKLNQMEINGMKKKHNLIIGTQFRSWYIVLVAVQSLSHVWLFVIPWTAAHQAALSFAISWSLLKHMSFDWWWHPTILSSVALFSFSFQSAYQRLLIHRWCLINSCWMNEWFT